jgi:hypothetical protein
MGYGPRPFLEHELDGEISLRSESWPPVAATTSLGLDIHTSSRNTFPGILQLHIATSVTSLNQVLDKIIRQVQFKVPPSSLRFRNMALHLNVDRGKVQTDKPWLELEGIRILSSNDLDIEGNIRLHGARNGERVDLHDLVGTFGMEPAND